MNENYHFLIKDPLYSDHAVYSELNPLAGGVAISNEHCIFIFWTYTSAAHHPLPLRGW